MAYATQSDLLILRPDLDEGGADWRDQLALASVDILERIKSEYWVAAVREKFGISEGDVRFGQIIALFDAARLNAAALKNATCYLAMSRYIYPTMTRDTEDGADAFSRRADRYAKFYDEEWGRILKMAIYDFDGDSQFQDFERASRVRTVRVIRA
jgi:hypothetical protein